MHAVQTDFFSAARTTPYRQLCIAAHFSGSSLAYLLSGLTRYMMHEDTWGSPDYTALAGSAMRKTAV
jgi:hypothetical protein